jgi:hypothetical protein
MKVRKIVFSLLFCCQLVFINAQVPDLYMVNIRGRLTNVETGEPIPYAHIINPRVHGGTTSNDDGYFSLQILTEDTLTIRAIGFVDEKFFVTEFPPKKLYVVSMKPVKFLLKEVTVTEDLNMRKKLGLPDAEPLNIPIELRGDGFNKKPPWYVAFLSPLSFAQYHLSGNEKEKRETLKAIQNNEEWLKFSTFHNLETIQRLTGLNDEEADRFMLYCNIHNRLPYFASQMEIEFQIMDLFFKYKKEQELIEKKD